MFALAQPRRRRRISLTPMIDVVFLLLVFFMLASRFDTDGALPLAITGAGAEWVGPPRLVDVTPTEIRLNGVATGPDALVGALNPLMPGPDATIVLRGRDGATLQALVDVMQRLRDAGLNNLALVE